MRFSVSVYPETINRLYESTEGKTEIELQSFGLKGVASEAAWKERAELYSTFVKEHPERTFHLHGPFLDLSYYTYDHLIAQVASKRIQDTCDLCKIIRPDHLVVHLNCPEYFCKQERSARWVENAANFWNPFLALLEPLGTTVVFENVMEPNPETAKAFLKTLQGDYRVGFCLDVGHALAFSALSPEDWVDSLGDHISHFHIHDNDGSDDFHQAPGEGKIDFPGLYEKILRHCPQAVISMEVETGTEETLKALSFSKDLFSRLL